MKKEILDILKKLMNIDSYSGNYKSIDKVFNYIKSIMSKSLDIKMYEFNKCKTMVISNTVDKNLDIIFGVHIDVVPNDEYKFKKDNKNVYGRGSIDMKGAVSVILNLLNNNTYSKKIALIITSDEEIDGNCMKQILKEYNTKLAIIPDGGSNFDLIKEEKGLLQVKVSIKTKSAHASKPFDGVNAITELFRVYNELITKYPLPVNEDDYKTSINLSTICGGKNNNSVPDTCSMVLDIRHINNDKKEDIISYIKSFGVDVDVIASGSLFKTDINNSFIQNYIGVCEKVIGRKVKIKSITSTSDAIYFSDKDIPTIIMNPDGGNPHCPDEFVSIDGLVKLYKIYEEFLKEEN